MSSGMLPGRNTQNGTWNRLDGLSISTIAVIVTARILETKGIISDRCELNRQIKAENALLREMKATVKKMMQAEKIRFPPLRKHAPSVNVCIKESNRGTAKAKEKQKS